MKLDLSITIRLTADDRLLAALERFAPASAPRPAPVERPRVPRALPSKPATPSLVDARFASADPIAQDDLAVARVLDEDDDFLTVQIAKHDAVTFSLNQAVHADAPPDRFLTVLFLRKATDEHRTMRPWKPWEA